MRGDDLNNNKEIKSNKIRRILPLIIGISSIIISAYTLYVHQGELLVHRILGIVGGLYLIIGGMYRMKAPIQDELFVDDLLRLKKSSLNDEEIKKYLKDKYGSEIYNRVLRDK